MTNRLVRCSDHKYAPGVVICVHLFNGNSTTWCQVTPPNQEEDDWLCPECFARIWTLGVDDLRTVCMHCARKLRAGGEELPTDAALARDEKEQADQGGGEP